MLKNYGLVILVFVWFVIATGLTFWLSSVSKSEFDPKLRLSQAIMDLNFENNLVKQLKKISLSFGFGNESLLVSSKQGAIYHITQGDCHCEWLADSHQRSINKWAQNHSVAVHAIQLKNHPILREFVPSTPAIVVINEDNKLLYLGPYSRGSGCFSASGEVDEYLRLWKADTGSTNSQQSLPSTIIETDASGCYCST